MKEEIEKFLQTSEEEKKEDPPEAKRAVKISILGYIVMIPGTILWTNIYIFMGTFTLTELTIIALFGSTLVGLSGFLISIGSYIYLNSPRRVRRRHWVYKGVFRTFLQLYSWYSFIAIFITTRRFSTSLTFEFFSSFIILSFPAILGYPLAHWSKIRSLLEDLLSDSEESSPT